MKKNELINLLKDENFKKELIESLNDDTPEFVQICRNCGHMRYGDDHKICHIFIQTDHGGYQARGHRCNGKYSIYEKK